MWITIAQLLLSLSILVILHECGHFFPAKWFKTRVEKFYLFFNPYFSLFKKQIGETEYGIGWLPLGGYVKIAGMVDESFDTAQLQNEPQPWEFRSKPAWQRLIIMIGGVTINFILGFFIFAMLLWSKGIDYIKTEDLKYGITTDSVSRTMGFQDGDLIVGVQGEKLDRFDRRSVIRKLVFEDKHIVNLLRDGQPLDLALTDEQIAFFTKYDSKDYLLWGPRTIARIKEVTDDSPAKKSGVMAGDRIIGINQSEVIYVSDVKNYLSKSEEQNFNLSLLRGSDTINLALSTQDKKMGVYFETPADQLIISKESFTFLESLPKGVTKGIDLLSDQLKAFGHMFAGKIKAKDSLGGFASIAGMFDKTWDWPSFWHTTAIVSIILGFMNLLPIPALDGGYVLFLLIEVVTGRKVSDKFIEKATMIGFILLLGLLLYANGLDVLRHFGK